MKLIRKCLIYSHRYLGIAISLMVVMWFVSGIVMMYAGGMPRLSPEMRLERMQEIDLSKVKLSPAEASNIASAFQDLDPGGAGPGVLLNVLDRPAYRFQGLSVYADDGGVLTYVDADQSREIAAKFARVPMDKVHFVETLKNIDQWTLLQSRQMPLYKFAIDDGAGSEVYVQQENGEVAMHTTSRTRLLAWLGTIPHWLYFTALRQNQPLWYEIVVWTSIAACVLAAIGFVLGFVLVRLPKPFKLSAMFPYSGWVRLHLITGFVFGLFTLTWLFSGLLSMEPFEWTRAQGITIPRDTFATNNVDMNQFARMDAATWAPILGDRLLKEVAYIRIDDRDYYDVRTSDGPVQEKKRERLHQPYYITGRADKNRVLVSPGSLEIRTEPLAEERMIEKIAAEIPDVPIVEHEILKDYDSYYYSRGRLTPLPVLRVKFADAGQTWLYVDPEMGQVLSSIPRLARIERWFYNGLHSLDFPFWYDKRPLWDIGVLTLLLGGLLSSMIGFSMGLKRLVRNLAFSKPRVEAPVSAVRNPS